MSQRNGLLVAAAAVLVAALLFGLSRWRTAGEEATEDDRDPNRIALDSALVRRLPPPVVSYLAECGYERTLTDEPVAFQRELNRCIGGLADAMEAILRSDTARVPWLDLQFTAHRENIDRILETQGESLESAPAREMLGSAAVLLAQLREARYTHVPGLAREVAQTRRAARELEQGEPLFDQRSRVEEVLDRAGNAVVLMAQEEVRRAELR